MDLDKLGKLKIQKIINDGKSITYDRFEYLFKKYPNKTKCLIVNYLAEKGIDLIEQEIDEIIKSSLELDKDDFKGVDNRYLVLEYKSGKDEYLDILIENNINLVRIRAYKLKSFLKNTLEEKNKRGYLWNI